MSLDRTKLRQCPKDANNLFLARFRSSKSDCQRLALEAADFRRLLHAHPGIKKEIKQVAQQRTPPGQG